MLNNSKNEWSRLNKLLNDDTCKSDNVIFCDADLDIYINQILSSHFFKPTSVSEIIQIIYNSKNSFTCDYHDISMNFIKLIGNYIAIPLTYLFNKCITIGYFPNCLTIAKVIVIHKSGKKNNIGNYRPISLLPQISKILENIIKERLLNYNNKHIYIIIF